MRSLKKRFCEEQKSLKLDVTVFNINCALVVHLLNFLGSILTRPHFIWHTQAKSSVFASYQVPIYTPGAHCMKLLPEKKLR